VALQEIDLDVEATPDWIAVGARHGFLLSSLLLLFFFVSVFLLLYLSFLVLSCSGLGVEGDARAQGDLDCVLGGAGRDWTGRAGFDRCWC
jgi:hypothetical protein